MANYLVFTNQRDLTSDYIIREFKLRGLNCVRINTECISQSKFNFEPVSGHLCLETHGVQIDFEDVLSAYFRRPEVPISPVGVNTASAKTYCSNEWSSLLKAIYILIGDRWFSHPSSIVLAEDKPMQLKLAAIAGFDVPETIITNDFDLARNFVNNNLSIGKPLRDSIIEVAGEERVAFTTRVENLSELDRLHVALVPIIFQKQILKRVDIRVTVVADRVFATAIHSQESSETRVDWRSGSNSNLRHERIDLPPVVVNSCIKLVKSLKLKFGAIDLVEDVDGKYWFLECNPNGQWAWIENRTGWPIASAIVDEMERIGKKCTES